VGEHEAPLTCRYLPQSGAGAHVRRLDRRVTPLRAEQLDANRWQLAGRTGMGLINDYLGYLAGRGYSAQTARAYASFSVSLAPACSSTPTARLTRAPALPSRPAGPAASGSQRQIHQQVIIRIGPIIPAGHRGRHSRS